MAVYRQIQLSFWQDDFILELTPEEKYFYLYLMLSSKSRQCGIYRISNKVIEFETGYSLKKIKELLNRFVDYKKILYNSDANEIMILNWVKYNFINSKNTISCMNKELKEVKTKEFIIKLYEICLERGYDVESTFKGLDIEALIGSEKEPKSREEESQDRCYKESLTSSYEGAYKDLGEEEEKEEEEIKEKEEEEIEAPYNHNFNDETKSMNSINDYINPIKVFSEFNKNIHLATISDIEFISKWRKDFEDEIIIEAIKEAEKYKGKSSKYINSILKNWGTLGLDTYEKVKNRNKRYKKPEDRPNSDAYKYVD